MTPKKDSVLTEDDILLIRETICTTIDSKIDQTIKVIMEVERERILEIMRKEHNMICPIDEKARPCVKHAIGIIKDMGHGDMEEGLREFRRNESWVTKFRKSSERYNTHIMLVLIGLLVLSLGNALWTGIKTALQATGAGQ